MKSHSSGGAQALAPLNFKGCSPFFPRLRAPACQVLSLLLLAALSGCGKPTPPPQDAQPPDPAAPVLTFSKRPAEEEITRARVFLEPLVPAGGSGSSADNAVLAQALLAYNAQKDTAALEQFLKDHPDSRWSAALSLNLARSKYEAGYLSEALALWEAAWSAAKSASDPAGKAVADSALAELLLLDARLGRTEELEKYLAEIQGRNLTGSVEQKVEAAREGLRRMKNSPQIAFKCGPFAIDRIAGRDRQISGRSPLIEAAASTAQGTNLAQVEKWAGELGLKYQMAKRSPGAAWIAPAVMHWKLGHFAAILEEHNGKYHVVDPTFGEAGNFWLAPEALEAETSGYFLVPEGPLPEGWQAVGDKEGEAVWGRGGANSRNEDDKTCSTPQVGGGGGGGGGMASPSAYSMQATLALRDIPLGYAAPVGPPMLFELAYNYLETNQPGTFTFTNFTPNWSFNWLSYLTVDASRNVTVRLRGGGSEVFPYSLPDNVGNAYAPNVTSQAVLKLVSANTYHRLLPNGAVEVYDKMDGGGRIFLTRVLDPQGNAATLTYDANFRLTAVTDAAGKQTTLAYVSNTVGNSGYYLVAQITDPYGRAASFSYDAARTTLLAITDAIGIVSQFTYDTGSFIAALDTPYGRTLFYKYIPPNDPSETSRGLRFTWPDGSTSVIENWLGADGETKSSYYWDRHATQLYPDDPAGGITTHCRTTYWLVKAATAELQAVPGWVKPPLESQVNYEYPGQSSAIYLGSSNRPTKIFRQLDSGTQVYEYQYNALGRVTRSVDPVGRTFSFFYAANDIDLLEARQTRGGASDLLGKWIYNTTPHRPDAFIDGSGRRTQFVYNSRGQPTAVIDAYSNTTSFVYNGTTAQLTEIAPSNTLPDAKTTFTYDNTSGTATTAGLPKTIAIATGTASSYTLSYTYDNASRPLTATYPDGTFEQVQYIRLDPVLFRDRLGRWSQQGFDALRQKLFETDPLGRTVNYVWCTCGHLLTLADPNGNTTSWSHDLEGRVILKTYANSGTTGYVYENTTSRLKSTTDALGQTKTFAYNLDNTLAEISYTNAVNPTSGVSFSYDPDYPRLLTAQNGWGAVGYTYNPFITDPFGPPSTGAGLVQSATNSVLADSAVTYGYDNLGRLTSRSIDGANNASSWVYDAISRVTSGSNALGNFTCAYHDSAYGFSEPESLSYPNGQVTNFSWYGNTADRRLQTIRNVTSGSAVISQFDYSYDATGNITEWIQTHSGTSATYALGYDFAGQLTSAVSTVSGSTAQQFYYNYDAAANRLSEQVDANITQGTFNNLNQLTNLDPGGATRFSGTLSKAGTVTVGGTAAFMNWSKSFTANPVLASGTNTIAIVARNDLVNSSTNTYQVVVPTVTSSTLTYDAVGNLTGDGTNTYAYDAENRLIQIAYSGSGNNSQFTYDPLGRRAKIVERSGGSVTGTKQFVYAGLDMAEERNASNTVIKRFYGTGVVVSGTSYFTTADHLGSVREITDSSQTVQARYGYDPYGRTTKLSGTIESDFGFTGYYRHLPSTLDFSPTRPYFASFGRFMSRDPLGEGAGINLYGYAADDPISIIDPWGLAPVAGGGTGAGAALFDYLMNGGYYDTPVPDSDTAPCPTAMDTTDFGAIGDAGGGFGDMASFGLGSLLRSLTGSGDMVDPASNAYRNGQLAALPLMFIGAGEGALAKGGIRVLEEAKGTIHLSVSTSKGTVEIISSISQSGKTITLSGLHIGGPGAGTLGRAGINELKRAAAAFGTQRGANRLVVQGGTRSSGKMLGKTPRSIIINIH